MARGTATATRAKWKSRAVLRPIEAGNFAECAHCGERVKFQAKVRKQQVICNVYIGGRWDRVEHFHSECYEAGGEPYGSPNAAA
jgi:hypothetical protein